MRLLQQPAERLTEAGGRQSQLEAGRTVRTAGLSYGGTIYDPGSGKTYRASLSVVGENRIELRGYVGIPLIGRTTSWFRVGSEQEACREAS